MIKLPVPLKNAYGDPLWVVCVYPTFTQVYNNTNGGDMYYDYAGGQMLTLNIRRYGGIVSTKIEYDNIEEKTKKLKNALDELMSRKENVGDVIDTFEYLKHICKIVSTVEYPTKNPVYLNKMLKRIDEMLLVLYAQLSSDKK